jgi:Ser/Thr protein kinase RdoA (MazF antagonist)
LQSPFACQLLRPGWNDSYLLETETGRYFVRVYGARWRTASEIAYELDLITHLARKGVSVSTPIHDREHNLMRPLEAPEGIRYLVVFSYAAGRPLNWENSCESYLAGQMAATIHTASEDFVSRHRRFSRDLEYLIDAPMRAIRPYLAHRPEDRAYLEALAGRLRRLAARAADRGLDWGACHGDLGNRNLHIFEGVTVTAFDFDLCGAAWRAWDLAPANWLAAYSKKPAIWDAFLRGYRKTRPTRDADVAAVPLFRLISLFWGFGMEASSSAHWGTVHMRDPKLDYYVTTLREWESDLLPAREALW